MSVTVQTSGPYARVGLVIAKRQIFKNRSVTTAQPRWKRTTINDFDDHEPAPSSFSILQLTRDNSSNTASGSGPRGQLRPRFSSTVTRRRYAP